MAAQGQRLCLVAEGPALATLRLASVPRPWCFMPRSLWSRRPDLLRLQRHAPAARLLPRGSGEDRAIHVYCR